MFVMMANMICEEGLYFPNTDIYVTVDFLKQVSATFNVELDESQ